LLRTVDGRYQNKGPYDVPLEAAVRRGVFIYMRDTVIVAVEGTERAGKMVVLREMLVNVWTWLFARP